MGQYVVNMEFTMRNKVALITVCFLMLFLDVHGSCPDMNDIDIMYDDDHFLCARCYSNFGHSDPLLACNGCSAYEYDFYDFFDGEVSDVSKSCGSLMVKAGCTFRGYQHNDFNGDYQTFEGPATYPRVTPPGDHIQTGCANYYRAYTCSCRQEPISCVPEDDFHEVASYDNTGSSIEVDFSYQRTVGTTYNEEVSSQMSIDSTIEEELSIQFFSLFSETLGISVTTGYDWTHVSSLSQGEEITYSVSATVPGGMLFVVEQAVGLCDGSSTKTEMFRTATYNFTGHLVEANYEKATF